MSETDLQELSIQVEKERQAREWPPDVPKFPESRLEDQLEKRAKGFESVTIKKRDHGWGCQGLLLLHPMGPLKTIRLAWPD